MKLNNSFLFVVGGALLVGGISLVLSWWLEVVLLFKGVIGMALALAGLLALYLIRDESKG